MSQTNQVYLSRIKQDGFGNTQQLDWTTRLSCLPSWLQASSESMYIFAWHAFEIMVQLVGIAGESIGTNFICKIVRNC